MSVIVGEQIDGPWSHRWVAANGARFHVAESGTGPLVLFLHGFPEFWWAWRHQLPALADLGYRAAAMDLRGYGRSDKTPHGYDPMTLAGDVAGLIRSLGYSEAILVGHGIGGYVAWATAAMHPRQVRALAAVSSPHPSRLRQLVLNRKHSLLHGLSFQVPILPERRIVAHHAAYVEQLLRSWAAPGSGFPDPEASARYRDAMLLWPAPHCALEYYRWIFRSRLRADGRRFNRATRPPIGHQVLQLHGELDPVVSRTTAEASARHVTGIHRSRLVTGAGHFPHEERPEEFTKELASWLGDLPPASE